MNLGRVIGTVVATRKYEGLAGVKLLLVQPLDHMQKKVGEPIVAADTVRAGSGELIYYVNSREAALALDPWFVPVDAAIVGIVDDVDAGGIVDDVDAEGIVDAAPARHGDGGGAGEHAHPHGEHKDPHDHPERHGHKHGGRRKNGARI
jgi:ethanolamine utilization protein EutN